MTTKLRTDPPVGNSAEQMAARIKGETDKFARLVKGAKVTIE